MLPEVFQARILPLWIINPTANVVFKVTELIEYQNAAAVKTNQSIVRHFLRLLHTITDAGQLASLEIQRLTIFTDSFLEDETVGRYPYAGPHGYDPGISVFIDAKWAAILP